jgi:ABC-type Mn2+/Zn2+ transport system ATPase subunit
MSRRALVASLMCTMNSLLRLDSLVRDFGAGDGTVRALDDVSLTFDRGTFTAVMGPSGSGKSTLLQSAAGLDRPSSGRVFLGELELSALGERKLARVRRSDVSSRSPAFVMSISPMRTRPASTRSRPAAQCSSVDLPEPDGPMTAVQPPRGNSTVTSSTARTAAAPRP